jgi:ABC-type Na+ efflux pump permease subunit
MRFIALTLRKDLTRVFRDPVGLIVWISTPAIITALVSLISTGPQPMPHGKLLIVDLDRSFISGALTNVFTRPPFDKMLDVQHVDETAGRRTIDAGDASALIEIPAGFGAAAMRQEHSTVSLWVNPSQRIVPNMIRQVLLGALESGMRPPPPQLQSIDIESQTVGERPKPLSLPALFFPGMLMLAVFGLSQSMALEWWAENTQGTLRRVLATPRPFAEFVAGKTAAFAVVSAGITLFGMGAAKWILASQPRHFALAVAWLAGSGVALYLMSSLLQMAAGDQRSGLVINQFVLFLLSMMGGTFFPFEMMPKWLASIGRLTPNGFAVARYKDLIAGSIDSTSILIAFAGLGLFVAVEFLVLSRRLRGWAV